VDSVDSHTERACPHYPHHYDYGSDQVGKSAKIRKEADIPVRFSFK
jgi:hypothetical protein